MTRSEFLEVLVFLTAATGQSFREEQAEAWFRVLGDLSLPAFKVAVERALNEREYPGLPPLGLLRRYASESVIGIAMTPEEAFVRVRQAIVRFGFYEPAAARALCGPEIWRAIEGIGGWERICDSPIEQRTSLFAQFRDAWNRMEQRRQDLARLPAHLRPMIRDGSEPSEAYHPAVISEAKYLDAER